MDNFDLYGLMEDELGDDEVAVVEQELGQLPEDPLPISAWLLDADFDD